MVGSRLAGFAPRAYKSPMAQPRTSRDPRGAAALGAAAVELVVAVAENDVIGRGGTLPWHLREDLRRFKALTLGKPILMGRRTYESIGKALPGRTNLVLSRSGGFQAADCTVVGSLEQARLAAGADSALMVIGGAEVYRQCLPVAVRIHLTLVHTRVEQGDTFFAGWRGSDWRETFRERHPAGDKNDFDYSFITLERTRSAVAHG
jgi:dihydrofolate reductase